MKLAKILNNNNKLIDIFNFIRIYLNDTEKINFNVKGCYHHKSITVMIRDKKKMTCH